MKSILSLALLVGVAGASFASAAEPLPLIPKPVSVTPREGIEFAFSADTGIVADVKLAKEARVLAADLKKLTGKSPVMAAAGSQVKAGTIIQLGFSKDHDLPAGGYTLEVGRGIRIDGKDADGVFNGTRTLLQLLPTKLEDGDKAKIAPVTIRDFPRFGWRGMHLDVARNFVAPEDVKKFIDLLAFHKINVFHWHLSDDQGWRVEIKKYPKLTEVAAWRASTPPYGNRGGSDGKRCGGFYTQEQVKDIVAYAAARHITVMPEIDMPGHMSAVITAYPQFGNNDVPGFAPQVRTTWGIFYDVLAPTEETFKFVDDVFTELCAIFPSKYIHMGGDEAPKNQWETSPRCKEIMKKNGLKNGHDVQSFFVKRIEKILESKGRKLIGWNEIREGGLSPKATVMSWQGEGPGIASAKEGHDVVMATTSHLYFDYYQSPGNKELEKGIEYECIGGHVPVDKVYSYNPIPAALSPEEGKHILGVQAQLWSEYLHDYKKVEYVALPRMAALAEIAWTPLEGKNYEDFTKRLREVAKTYDAMGVRHGDIP